MPEVSEETLLKLIHEFSDRKAREMFAMLKPDDDRLAGEYTVKVKKWLAPILAAVAGTALSFAINSRVNSASVEMRLQEQTRAVQELKERSVSREVFEATIEPMRMDIQEIKRSVRNRPEVVIRYIDAKTGKPAPKPQGK
jgi:hypothetical protein